MKWGVIIALPFFALIRGGLFLHAHQWPVPFSIVGGVLASFLILLIYVGRVYVQVLKPDSYRWATLRTQAAVVFLGLCAFQGYVLFTPDPAHVQSKGVRAEYGELHPLLRTSVATLLLVDAELLITDLSRRPEDYARMGLPTNTNSLHYLQEDGYVHAMDLHTREHSFLRSRLTQAYFEILGFRTLRHVGTADHLHVALPRPTG